MQIHELLARLKGVKKTGPDKWDARCPAHDDKTPSLGIKEVEDRILLNCRAGCLTESICSALDIKLSDLYYESKTRNNGLQGIDLFASIRGHKAKAYYALGCKEKDGEIRFPMRNESEEIVSWRRRRQDNTPFFNGKKALSERDKNNGLIYDPKSLDKNNAVILCEGEIDLVAVISKEPSATVIATPGSTPGKDVFKMLPRLCAGKKVYLCPDPDKAGRIWREKVGGLLMDHGLSVNFIPPNGGDLDERLKSGESLSEILSEAVDLSSKEKTDPVMIEGLTDTGNARRLVRLHGDNFKFVAEAKSWRAWTGTHWEQDAKKLALRATASVSDDIRRQAFKTSVQSEEGQKWQEQQIKHANKSLDRRRRIDMLDLATAEPDMTLTLDEFDQNPWLLNTQNGTLDLREMELRKHNRRDMITHILPVAYKLKAKCPRWEKFLLEVFQDDEELVEFVQRAVGYALTGDISEQCIFVLYGHGSNGKSTLLDTLRDVLGPIALHSSVDTFTERDKGRIPEDRARLRGARFVTASEPDKSHKLDESFVKDATGGEPITARFLRENSFEFDPTFKLFFGCNHKPKITGTDDGIWRRIRLIPFNQRFEKTDDPALKPTIQGEYEGILNWAVEGCRKWQECGLSMPEAVKKATDSYRTESDLLGLFIEEHCSVDAVFSATAKELYERYKNWCSEGGYYPMNQRNFGLRLKEKGFDNKRGGGGAYKWVGIGLKMEEYETEMAFE